MTPTDEQLDIIAAAESSSDNLLINALAGTGKTATLELIERAIDTKPVLYLVFNKKNAEEAEGKMLSTTSVRTFNSIGHRIWAQSIGRNLTIPKNKIADIYMSILNDSPKSEQPILWAIKWDVISAVGLAKALGYVPDGKFPQAKHLISRSDFHASLEEEPDDLVGDLIDACLFRSIQQAYSGTIDYNDQIYMPALFGGTYPKYPLVMVDEVQDLNPVNHALLHKLVHNRVIAVGDPWQSIYAFRGADRHGMQTLQGHFNTSPFDLSISFRCPQAIVEHVHWRVPHFKWSKEGGSVDTPTELDSLDILDDSAILCRNNAPLFKVALNLLSAGRSVRLAGTDIGPKLVAMMKKLGPESLSRHASLAAIEEWESERIAKGSVVAKDLADCMRVFVNATASLGTATAYAEHLFKQKGRIQLMTGHKSKGLEFDTVYHLDPFLCKDTEQDKNLRYVISTRSEGRLVEIESERIKW